MNVTQDILEGRYPSTLLSLDECVAVVNDAGKALQALPEHEVDEAANNLFVWLGGVHKDIQLYACHHIFNYRKIEFDAEDKVEARLAYMEPHFKYGDPGQFRSTFSALDHRPWPVEYLSGETFEDRLEMLAGELREDDVSKVTTADMILSGVAAPTDLEFDQYYSLIEEGVEEFRALHVSDSPSQSQVYWDRLNNFSGWLMKLEPEHAILGIRMLAMAGVLTGHPSKTGNFHELSVRLSEYIMS